MKRNYTILWTMLAAAAIAIVFGIFVMKQRISTPPVTPNSNQTADQNSDQTTVPPTPEVNLSSTVGWKTYTNDKHGFSIQYPSSLKAGSVSDNSVLGTFQVPVRGLHVGPLVIVALEDKTLKKDAQDYFDSYYNEAQNPRPAAPGEPSMACSIDKVTNSQVVGIKSVSCNGEGGAARYAYITGKTYDVFIDGYSKGYDSQDNGSIASATDYTTILSTFIFTKDIATATPPATTPPTTTPTPTPPTATIQNFSITADDNTATPKEITVTKNAIAEITFNVSATNVYYGGLDFRSSVVNSGTIHSGESKTISFTATNSFEFTPYWPSSQVAKPYKIKVTVQ